MGAFLSRHLQFWARFNLPYFNVHLVKQIYTFHPFRAIVAPKSEPTNSHWTTIQNADGLHVLRHNSTIKICLNRPEKCNALTISMVEGITRLFNTLSADNSVHKIVITGHGRYFCTGMDLIEDISAPVAKRSAAFRDLFHCIDSCPKMTVALINGPAFGGGVGLATVCDVRLAVFSSYLCLSEVKLGLCPAVISKFLVREWGTSLARMAMMTGRRVSAQVLYNAGVIHTLVSDIESLEQTAEDFLSETNLAAPRAGASCKALVREAAEGSDIDGLISEVFQRMLDKDSESEYGVAQFQKGNRVISWEDITTHHGTSTY
ncbi:MAG: hypothetical protein M1820_000769 [Bogoriella megaspora]|nr:MAG: hypothetical protein M1820_000769 [Bogoriella megaspora]